MDLPIDLGEWTSLPDDEAKRLIGETNAHLKAQGDPGETGPFIHKPPVAQDGIETPDEEDIDDQLIVKQVLRVPLCFYPDGWAVICFVCDVASMPSFIGLEAQAYAFAIVGPEGHAERITLIDWESQSLHRLNALLALDLTAANLPVIRSYLIFFCSFLASKDEAGTEVPFLLPSKIELLSLDGAAGQKAEDDLELYVEPDDSSAADPFDLPERDDKASGLRSGVARVAPSSGNPRAKVKDAFDRHPGTPAARPRKTALLDPAASSGANAVSETSLTVETASTRELPDLVACFDAMVWHGKGVFEAVLEVARHGLVSMADDTQVTGPGGIGAPWWEIQSGRRDVKLLCRQRNRETVTAYELFARIKADIEAQNDESKRSGPAVRLRGLRVQGPLSRALTIKGTVKLNDVQFMKDVMLDNSSFDGSLELIGCRFMTRLSLCDATVKGSFRLDGSRIEGAMRKRIHPHPSSHDSLGTDKPGPELAFKGLKVERSFFADSVVVFGRARFNSMKVGAAFHARGLRVFARPGIDVNSSHRANRYTHKAAIRLTHAQVEGPIDISTRAALFESAAETRPIFWGNVDLNGMSAAQVRLDGIWVGGNLEAKGINVKVGFEMTPCLAEHSGAAWRPTILGNLSMYRSRMGHIAVTGSRIDGDFAFVEVHLATSLYAGLSWRFRTVIGDTAWGSGAVVSGSVIFSGAKIKGAIVLVTGRIGRLRADLDAWLMDGPRSGDLLPALCACEAARLEMFGVSIDSTVSLVGVKLDSDDPAAGSTRIQAENVRIQGGLLFHRDSLARDLLSNLSRSYKWHSDDGSEQRLADLAEEVPARIAGAVDLEGVRVGGKVDLSYARVDGPMRLDNAVIEGSLLVQPRQGDTSCSVSSWSMGGTRVSGNVDLRGLRVKGGDLFAHDMQVNGQILLATAADTFDEGRAFARHAHAVVEQGRINLDGSKATRLVLTSANIGRRRTVREEDAQISLARCKFGQLTVFGFTETRPPTFLRLRRITRVGACRLGRNVYRRSLTRIGSMWRWRPSMASKRIGGLVLRVLGLGPRKVLARSLNLSAVEVGDWHVDPRTEALPLLDATPNASFDARNYVEIEQRLVKIGLKDWANPVYRRMLWRSARSWRERLWYCASSVALANGTQPFRIFFWLIAVLALESVLLANPANVEFSSDVTKSTPTSDNRPYDLASSSDWNWPKAMSLAATYSVPFLTGERQEPVRARLIGPTCANEWMPAWMTHANPYGTARPARATPAQSPSTSSQCRRIVSGWSPHMIALALSFGQALLWILFVANLPVIARRKH